MNQLHLPKNIRAIIVGIDNELQDEYKNIQFDTNSFIESIKTIMNYYYKAIYKRIYQRNISEDELTKYNAHLENFIDKFTNGIYQLKDNNLLELKDDIMEIIAKDIIVSYWILQIKWCKENNVTTIFAMANKTADEFTKTIVKTITNINYFERLMKENKLNPLDVNLIVVKDKINCQLFDIDFVNMPKQIKMIISKILFKLNEYQQFITKKQIIFTDDKDIVRKNDKQFAKISYRNGLFNVIYHLIICLLEDKLMVDSTYLSDETFWKDRYAEIISHRYYSDESNIIEDYLYHPCAEINAKEYFLSCVVAYILEKESLVIFDNKAFKRLYRILDDGIEDLADKVMTDNMIKEIQKFKEERKK